MEDGYNYYRKNSGVLWRDGDFEEEDVWEILRESKDSTLKVGQSIESSNVTVTKHLPSAARMIPTSLSATSNVSTCCSISTTLDEADDVKQQQQQQQQSAPVNIPDWSKVSTNTRNGMQHHDDDGGGGEHNTKFPPHEIIANRLARSQIPSFSVFEGVGRKLKGRDLRRVRNAVLTKTGFLE